MAPIKRTRESSGRNRDKPKRRRRTEAEMLYQCLGKLCGEECDQEILPATETGRQNDASEDAMEGMSDYSDDERETRETRGSKSGRISKQKAKKAPASNHQASELPFKLGVQKAKRYICEALDFGVQSGYLTPKDPKGKVLRVSSDLLHVTEQNKARVLQRIASDVLDPRQERKSTRKRPHHDAAVCDGLCGEHHHDVPAEVEETHGKPRGVRKHRSRSRQPNKKRTLALAAARSRSRSKSKRRVVAGGARKKPPIPRSNRQVNPIPESRPSKQLKPDAEEQEELGESQTENRNGTRNEDNDEDGKSVKSTKSAKSTLNSDSQNTNEEKKQEDDGSNYEASDDEEDNKK